MEMGIHFYGLCNRTTLDREEDGYDLGGGGPTDEECGVYTYDIDMEYDLAYPGLYSACSQKVWDSQRDCVRS